jgi:transcriptional regulator
VHLPKHFEETRLDVLHELIRAYPLGSLVTLGGESLVVDHIPFVVDTTGPPHGTLRGHVARANSVWRDLADSMESLVVFQGPQAYVSPSWYPSKQAHGKVVPTWNYAAVHVFGYPRAIENKDWLLRFLTELVGQHESTQAQPWKITDAPSEYIDKMLEAIVGIEIPITRIAGKWKVSQNRPPADRLGVIDGLKALGCETASAMADQVRRAIG